VAFQEVMSVKDVDFCLFWDGTAEYSTSDEAKEKRRIFEKNVEEEGLIIEREKLETNNLNFVKIHAPLEVLRRYSEILKLRMPMKEVRIVISLSPSHIFFRNKNLLSHLPVCFLVFDICICFVQWCIYYHAMHL